MNPLFDQDLFGRAEQAGSGGIRARFRSGDHRRVNGAGREFMQT
jgi:hypothetical protein